MEKSRYLDFRNRYTPKPVKIIFVLESPPASGKYFYNPDGSMKEPLFKAMMKDVLGFTPSSKGEGLRRFAAAGFFLIDATYTPINRLKGKARDAIVLRDFPLLARALRKYAKRKTKVVLVKANICRLLEQKLTDARFNVLNHGVRIPFPSSGQQNKFHAAIHNALATNF
jgi:hypothetical protein